MPESTQVTFVIAGMHRSGTSLTASILQSAGVDIGDQLAPATATNVKGHFEDLEFVNFHKNVLWSQGLHDAGWSHHSKISVPEQYVSQAQQIIEKRRDKSLWGWKDPRTVLFLDFWHDRLTNPFYIFVYRSPWETIDSLYRRNIEAVDDVFYNNPNLALTSWEIYNRAILEFYQTYSHQSLLIPIEAIFENPNCLIDLIVDKSGVNLQYPPTDIADHSLLQKKVDNSHRPTLIKEYFPEIITLYHQLNQATVSSQAVSKESQYLANYQPWVLQDWLDVRRLEHQLQQTEADLEQKQHHILHLENENQSLTNKLSEIETSNFWKLRENWLRIKKILSKPWQILKND